MTAKMKSKVLKVMIGTAVCIGCGMYWYNTHQTQETTISPLMLENIEALAQGENNGNVICVDSGDIPCFGRTVKYRYDNMR